MIKKSLHTFPKLEDMEKDVNYAITIAPDNQFTGYSKNTGHFTYKSPHKVFKTYCETILKSIKEVEFILKFETSPTGRQHYHGLLRIADIEQFYTRGIYQLLAIGSICVKPLDDTDCGEWYTYCSKQDIVWGDQYDITIDTRSMKTEEPETGGDNKDLTDYEPEPTAI